MTNTKMLEFTANFRRELTEDTYSRQSRWWRLVCRRLVAEVYRGCTQRPSGSSGSIRLCSLCCSSAETPSSWKTENATILQHELYICVIHGFIKNKNICCDDKVTTGSRV